MSAFTHAGGVVHRRRGADPEFLVVTARRNPADWVLPKGHVEDGESPEAAAVREVQEETGVVADILEPLCDSELEVRGERQRIRYFLMESVEEGGSSEGRRTAWLTARLALQQLTFEESRRVLRSAIDAIQHGATMNPTSLADYLARTLGAELPHLKKIPDGPATAQPNRPANSGWSQREELGHLVDSAINNHNRIVRATLDGSFEGPGYEQDGWVAVHRYQAIPWPELVDVWHAHNRILLPLIAAIPESRLSAPCRVGASAPVTLGFLIDDYVLHMQHHLDNVLRRDPPTKYPRA